ncbi:MAG: D-glycerate dehydrogenase [Candidatus Omnitrophica bacterium]|nr:D-glycerate dehydrogenase [Candidatus Omnitrophota bacterium]
MKTFNLMYTGDYLDEHGQVALGDIALDLLEGVAHVKYGFLLDQKPSSGDPAYWDRLYSMEIQPHHVSQANGLVIMRPWVKASAFSGGADNLVVIGRAGAGYDKIDLDACTANDVAVFNAPDTLTHATASAALVFILALAKRLPEQERLARAGRWDLQPQVMGDDLPGKTLGIVGFGKTGAELARLAAPFRMRVLAYSPRAGSAQATALGVTLVPQLEGLFKESDFVSLHCRLEPHTRSMIGERELRWMKPTAYLINVARGELIQPDALVRCLRERWIAGAGLDVFDREPLPIEDPLLGLDNVILTPHWLPSTRQAARATMTLVANGMLRTAQGRVPENVVNPAVLERPGFRAKLARFAENQ